MLSRFGLAGTSRRMDHLLVEGGSGDDNPVPTQPSPKFYSTYDDSCLVALAPQAEEVFASNPPTGIATLRLFAELLASGRTAASSKREPLRVQADGDA